MPTNFPAAPTANIKGSLPDIINLSGLPVTGPTSLKTGLSSGNENCWTMETRVSRGIEQLRSSGLDTLFLRENDPTAS